MSPRITSTATKSKTAAIVGVVVGISILGGLVMGIFTFGAKDYRSNPQPTTNNNFTSTTCLTPKISNITNNSAEVTDETTNTFKRGDILNIDGCGFGNFYQTNAMAFTGADKISRSCKISTWTDIKITCQIKPDTIPGTNLEANIWIGGTPSNGLTVNITE
jgi:hypothetical protein